MTLTSGDWVTWKNSNDMKFVGKIISTHDRYMVIDTWYIDFDTTVWHLKSLVMHEYEREYQLIDEMQAKLMYNLTTGDA